MSNITRRIDKLEKLMNVGNEKSYPEVILVLTDDDGLLNEQERRDKLGPTENWLTYQEQLEAAREDLADDDIKFIRLRLSVEKELQAREFQNTPLEDEKRAERIKEYRNRLNDR